jgi:hypothetical protein
MTDFVRLDIESTSDSLEILKILSRELPDFKWNAGDSDAAGGYVSGINQEKVAIQIFTDEKPMDLSISFRSSKVDLGRKKQIADQVSNIVTQFGKIVRRRDT